MTPRSQGKDGSPLLLLLVTPCAVMDWSKVEVAAGGGERGPLVVGPGHFSPAIGERLPPLLLLLLLLLLLDNTRNRPHSTVH